MDEQCSDCCYISEKYLWCRMQAPALAVILLGALMALKLAWGLIMFQNKPQEALALHKASAAPPHPPDA